MNGFSETERYLFVWLRQYVAIRVCYRQLDPWRGLEIKHQRDEGRAMGFVRAAALCDVWLGFIYAWLLGIADKIGDPRYRATFLEAVPEHRRILALAGG